ncbi:alpha/beta hydrolase [Stenotrophomonas sp. 24(2023)]|uniref:alpha/beta hydrolase n=1 Tax=Stenotrophomonas sp. 24(2023) TaxID=3068324 RepID=UPI0027DFD76A|nr:alpha/beta hydrolase [Stenotrophomonas sp. 24(2023)]WMJ70878.1 alpha/beta hydrolase [Stenotrophomonas sp. 24(2023)]
MNIARTSLAAGLLAASIGSAIAAPPSEPAPLQPVARFLQALNGSGGTPIEQLSPQQARKVLTDAQAGATLPPAEVSHLTIQADGKPLQLVVVRPPNTTGKTLPVFMFFHGGGWVLGDFPTHERLIRDLVTTSGAVAVYVDYTPSPEARYPVAIRQAYAATRWVAEHGAQIGVDGTRLALAGNSVGGNMVAAVALQAKAAGTPAIRYDLMLWPVTDASFDTASYQRYENGYFLSRNMMTWFWDAYTTDPQQRAQILASPLRATAAQLAGLPPTLIQTAELDVLRDEGEAFGRKLDEAGVAVTVTRYNGLIHDYGLLNALSDVPAVREALRQAGDGLREHLK